MDIEYVHRSEEGCIVSVHCREEGYIGKYIPRGQRDFPWAGILHSEAREIARGQYILRADVGHVASEKPLGQFGLPPPDPNQSIPVAKK